MPAFNSENFFSEFVHIRFSVKLFSFNSGLNLALETNLKTRTSLHIQSQHKPGTVYSLPGIEISSCYVECFVDIRIEADVFNPFLAIQVYPKF